MEQLPLDFATPSPTLPDDLRTVSIGLSLSGGGYRAAAFHLGTLAYLDRVQLLPQLSRLSTVSGGTFTGTKYILSLVEGIKFADFFRDFYQFLSQTRLIEHGLIELSQGAVRVPSGERKFITAIANVYADTFLKQPNGEAYTFGQIMDADIPVKEVTFNATEFRTGIAFRFQRSENINARIGNGNISIPKEEAKKIRIADIVAASSCFPGGFEPMAFPDDFAWPNNQVPATVRAAIQKKPSTEGQENPPDYAPAANLTRDDVVALMDGGIYDNQGISSLLLADERQQSEELGLFIISDVDRANDDLFPYPQSRKSSGNLTLGQVDWLIQIFLITCVLTVGSIAYELWREITQGTFVFGQHFFSALMPLILSSLVTATLWYGRRVIRTQLLPLIPQVGIDGWRYLKTLKLHEAVHFIWLRVDSLLALTQSVFMDRIKDLIFRQVYGNKRYDGKRISNRIDRLITRSTKLPDTAPLSEALKTSVKAAVNMPTTLWFEPDQPDKERQIVALTVAGQATICFNLLQYIVRRYGEEPAQYPPAIQRLWTDLQTDWKTLNDHPQSLLEELLHSS